MLRVGGAPVGAGNNDATLYELADAGAACRMHGRRSSADVDLVAGEEGHLGHGVENPAVYRAVRWVEINAEFAILEADDAVHRVDTHAAHNVPALEPLAESLRKGIGVYTGQVVSADRHRGSGIERYCAMASTGVGFFGAGCG